MPFQSSPAPSVDQIPTFSSSQGAVKILVAILAREPEMRDKILKETVADPRSLSGHEDDDFDDHDDRDDSRTWTYVEWIGYLKGIIMMCGVNISSTPAAKAETGNQGTAPADKRKRRHTAAAASKSNMGGGGIMYEPGEDREVMAYLVSTYTHLDRDRQPGSNDLLTLAHLFVLSRRLTWSWSQR